MDDGLISVIERLREKQPVSDQEFDVLYPERWRTASTRYWTSLEVATLAVDWLTGGGVAEVLDVGSGVGKLCLAGALRTTARFVGVEHRAELVAASREAAATLGVDDRTTFIHGAATVELLSRYQALYLYNPFGENRFLPQNRLDDRVPLGERRFVHDVRMVERALEGLGRGCRLVTYHGFGGHVPDSFTIHTERSIGGDFVRLWVKDVAGTGGYFKETEEGAVHVRGRLP